MNHTKHIAKLVQELIEKDPTFANKQDILTRLLTEMYKAKQKIVISDSFVSTLKSNVLEQSSMKQSFIQRFINSFYMDTKYIALGATGLVMAVLIAVGAYTLYTPGGTTTLVTHTPTDTDITTIALGPQAFGSLAEAYTTDTHAPAPASLGIEAAISSRSIENPAVGFGGGMAVSEPAIADNMMILPYYVYEYTYIGDTFELPSDLPVYRRAINPSVGKSMADLVRGFDNGMIELPSGLMVEHMNLRTTDGKGFSYHVDMRSQTVNINEEYSVYHEGWDGRTALDDTALIRIATQFLQEKGVDTSSYGAPIVDTRYKRYQSDTNFVPQQLSVVFPILTPTGDLVYERSGDMPAGLGVTVDQASKKGVSAYNIKRMQFESSAYALTTDIDRVLDIANQGGEVYEPWRPEDADIATFTLGTPSVVYIEYYRYNEQTMNADELYIPALRFPIVDRPEVDVYYSPEYVTVPLVAELLAAPLDEPTPYPMPRPLPVEPLESPAVVPTDSAI